MSHLSKMSKNSKMS